MTKPIINLADVSLEEHAHGDRFQSRYSQFAGSIGGRLLGYSLTVVPPGKRAWPHHCHHVNEEMFLILEGTGVVRIGDAEHPIRAGDVIAAPPGGPATAHQIINTSDRELRYLSVSTKIAHDIIEYPDSSKVAMYVGDKSKGDPAALTFRFCGRLGPATEYWDGE